MIKIKVFNLMWELLGMALVLLVLGVSLVPGMLK